MTSLVDALHDGGSGVHRTDRSAADVVGLGRRAGWRIVRVEMTRPTDKAAFLDICHDAFELPDSFEHNWDAFADVVDDLQDDPGTLVVFDGLHHLDDKDRDVVQQILTERVDEVGGRPFLAVATGA